METLIQLILSAMAVFMILLVLVQRGRGGGLAGALGGAGGSSAFGAKAGDTFTKITIYAASVWIVTCVLSTYWANNRGDAFGDGGAPLVDAAATAEEAVAPGEETGTSAETPADETAAPPADAPADTE